jgi:hypothetical protein
MSCGRTAKFLEPFRIEALVTNHRLGTQALNLGTGLRESATSSTSVSTNHAELPRASTVI